MHRLIGVTISLCWLLNSGAEAQTSAPANTLEVRDDFIIPVTINGTIYRWEVSPEGNAARVLNADIAKRLALKPSMIGGIHMVGPVRLIAASDSVRIDYGGIVRKDRLFWFDRPASDMSDGAVHPAMLPYSHVRFVLGPKGANERESLMPLDGVGIFGVGGGVGKFKYGDAEIHISFSLKRQEALMTAPTAVLLATEQGGAFSEQQRQAIIRFGVERPVRLLRFERPFSLFERPVTAALVRVSDFGDASIIPDGTKADQDEIIVTGKAKKKPQYSIILGRDFLKGCSSLTYDMKAKLIRLSCQP
ncbi:MAG: hypothetical protein RLZZ61_524 [Pseudomonadota bacterium]|jgi:hypothetical protein